MNREIVQVNGVRQAQVAVSDRALQYGDGLFETLRVAHGRPLHFARHLARLRRGCERLGIASVPWDTLASEMLELAAPQQAAVLKVIVSRGSGPRGYRYDKGQATTRILSVSALPEWPAHYVTAGIRMRLCDVRLALQPALAGIKHLNRLEQVLARAEWDDPDIGEGLMFDSKGRIAEGTMSNLFLVRGGRLLTPDLSECGVAGVMRSVILDLAAQHDIPCGIQPLTLDDARSADEVFVCNSLIGIWPVKEIAGVAHFPVGRLTRVLLAAPEIAGDSDTDNWYSS